MPELYKYHRHRSRRSPPYTGGGLPERCARNSVRVVPLRGKGARRTVERIREAERVIEATYKRWILECIYRESGRTSFGF